MSPRSDRHRTTVCVVYYGVGTDPTAFRLSRTTIGVGDAKRHVEETRPSRVHPHRRLCTPWRSADELFAKDAAVTEPAVLIVDESMRPHFESLRSLPAHVIVIAGDEVAEEEIGGRAQLSVVGMRNPAARLRTLRAACRFSCARVASARWWRRVVRSNRELRALHDVGMSLMFEHDRAVLVRQVVDMGKRFTESDGGVMFLVKTDERQTPYLDLAYYDIDSMQNVPLPSTRLEIDNESAIGHAAVVGRPLVIADVRELPMNVGFTRSTDFEDRYGFRLRSMLIVPMLDQNERVVGVLLFTNRKSDPNAKITNKEAADRYVLPYTGREVRLARSLASQAAMSVENAHLYAQIEQILESFVIASVTAIDQRDPTTAGHSIRVATLTADLALATERAARGSYRDVRFTRKQMRELHYAAMLHDFGKITVSEDVLVKAKKLPPLLWERVDGRFEQIRLSKEIEYYKARDALLRAKRAAPEALDRLEARFTRELEQIARMRDVVRDANEPTIVDTPAAAELEEISRHTFERADGSVTPYLATDELRFLQLARGTLDDHERAEIQSHVEETHRFLARIPWTDDLKNLVAYAYGHHEKLDGSGYPRGITAPEIPVQTRLMTVADIFDALTESDRPYKRAVSSDVALDILRGEATDGRLDAELVDVLVESGVYRRILETDWRDLAKEIVSSDVTVASVA